MSAKNSCETIDLAAINPNNIVFQLRFKTFWLDTEDGDVLDDDEDEEDEDEEDEYGYLWGRGFGSIYLVDDHEDEDEYDLDGGMKVADFKFILSPDENAQVKITKVLGNYVNLDTIVKQWNETNQAEFLGSEIDCLLTDDRDHISESTLEHAYVG